MSRIHVKSQFRSKVIIRGQIDTRNRLIVLPVHLDHRVVGKVINTEIRSKSKSCCGKLRTKSVHYVG